MIHGRFNIVCHAASTDSMIWKYMWQTAVAACFRIIIRKHSPETKEEAVLHLGRRVRAEQTDILTQISSPFMKPVATEIMQQASQRTPY
jgi:hypothetical protein